MSVQGYNWGLNCGQSEHRDSTAGLIPDIKMGSHFLGTDREQKKGKKELHPLDFCSITYIVVHTMQSHGG